MTTSIELHRAIKRGDMIAVRRFLDEGGDVHMRDGTWWTPIEMAALQGNTPIIQLFLDAGADVNQGWPGKHTPLTLAAISGSAAAVALLLARGCKTDAGGLPVPELLRLWGYRQSKIVELIQEARDTAG